MHSYIKLVRNAIQNKVKQIKADLNDKELRIIERAYDRLKENMDNPGPDDEDYINRP